ncbi:MAG: elongation factor Ts, partial [Gammaproteobacteria bacterium]|nr:elongation factor Ts [Gammaproteobacteria bacterium]
MQITAALVKELRERTGAGMMECKRTLVEASGDIEAAVEVMRKSGQAKADKKAGRIAAEGLVAIKASDDGKSVAMVEVNSETDFVTKGDDFQAFAQAVASCVLTRRPSDLTALLELTLPEYGSASVEASRRELIAKIGENINVRRFHLMENQGGTVGVYLHGTRIGVLVALEGGDASLAKDIAMHIAASRPICIAEQDMPQELLEKEGEIFSAQAAQSGKPENIIEKMIAGRMKKYLKEVTLLGQPFVKDQDISVEKLLAGKGAKVIAFKRIEVGGGI